MDIVSSWLTNRLLENEEIVALVDTRIYAGHISMAPQPEYPCLTIYRSRPGFVERYFPYEEFPITIGACSTESSDQTMLLHDLVKSYIHGQVATQGTKAWVMHQRTTPIYTADRTERLVHMHHSIYDICLVG